jgi:hypothetical protein
MGWKWIRRMRRMRRMQNAEGKMQIMQKFPSQAVSCAALYNLRLRSGVCGAYVVIPHLAPTRFRCLIWPSPVQIWSFSPLIGQEISRINTHIQIDGIDVLLQRTGSHPIYVKSTSRRIHYVSIHIRRGFTVIGRCFSQPLPLSPQPHTKLAAKVL